MARISSNPNLPNPTRVPASASLAASAGRLAHGDPGQSPVSLPWPW